MYLELCKFLIGLNMSGDLNVFYVISFLIIVCFKSFFYLFWHKITK